MCSEFSFENSKLETLKELRICFLIMSGPQVLELLASGFGSVGALVSLLSVPFCSGLESAVKLLGALAQNIAGVAVEVVRQGTFKLEHQPKP